ncbi:MAG: ThiF family adenylyltransferase [Candidatus Sungbacteria bacterium]|nr:ThiF family adenylyltransferase [Candidatus Sungbacteria bacterium]
MANFQRQLDILPPQALVYPVHCIGLGGIGSNTAFYLRKMGFNHFTLWDHDVVEAHNVPSQHFFTEHIVKSKTQAVADQLMQALDAPLTCIARPEKCDQDAELSGIVVAGVDTMPAREDIWRAVLASKTMVPLYIDGRIGVVWDGEEAKVTAELIEIFTIMPLRLDDRDLYEDHLGGEAEPLRCTAQAVAYIGAFVAGFICANIRKWITKQPYHRYILYDCLTNQVLVAKT